MNHVDNLLELLGDDKLKETFANLEPLPRFTITDKNEGEDE